MSDKNIKMFGCIIEAKALNIVLRDKSVAFFTKNAISEKHFTLYKEHYKYIMEHHSKYNTVPTMEMVRNRFSNEPLEWLEVDEPEEFIVSGLEEARLFREVQSGMQEAVLLMQSEKTDEAVALMAKLSQTYHKEKQTKCVDLIDDAKLRYDSYVERAESPSNYFVTTGLDELDRIIGGWDRKNDTVVVCARPGVGKCLEKGTLVLMCDGTRKPVERISVGDKVQSLNGANTVVGTHNGFTEGYKIIPAIGKPFTITKDHILTLCKNEKYIDISIEDYMRMSREDKLECFLKIVAVDYPTQQFCIAPYAVGTWCGNSLGAKSNTEYSVNTVEEVLYAQHIPHIYLTGDKRQRLELLGGIVDTRGELIERGIRLTVADRKELVDDIEQLCRGLGFATQTKLAEYKGEAYRDIYIYGNIMQIPSLARFNMDKEAAYPDSSLLRFEVQPVGQVEYYGFACDGDNRFLLGDNIITHNSWLTIYFALQAAKAGLRVGYYSGEMETDLVGYRMDTFNSNFSNGALTHGNDNVKEAYKEYIDGIGSTIKGHLFCATPDTFGGDVTVSKIRAFIERYDLQMVCIDQLSLMSDERGARDNRIQYSNLSKDLRTLQRTTKIPFIIAVQQNREDVEEKGVGVQNIAESDRIGQDATTVLFIERKNGNIQITVGKARNANTGDKLLYDWDINTGNLTYLPSEKDAVGGVDEKELREEYNDKKRSDSVF